MIYLVQILPLRVANPKKQELANRWGAVTRFL
jgi:hypothetical protein